jgi:hypothetical protein
MSVVLTEKQFAAAEVVVLVVEESSNRERKIVVVVAAVFVEMLVKIDLLVEIAVAADSEGKRTDFVGIAVVETEVVVEIAAVVVATDRTVEMVVAVVVMEIEID